MGILLGVYKELAKEAEAQAQYADLQEKVDFLSKYAEAATELLNAEFPNDYEKQDVVELADRLIQRDVEIAEVQEKTAEAVETLEEYVKVARALLDEQGEEYYDTTVEKLASSLFELDAENQFYKEAAVIAEAGFVDEFNKLAETDFTTIADIEEAMKMAGFGQGMLAGAKNMLGDIGAGFKNLGAATGSEMKAGKQLFKDTLRAGAPAGDVQAARQLYYGAQKDTINARKAIGATAAGVAGVGGIGYAATRGGNN
jgi:hypothetical protein